MEISNVKINYQEEEITLDKLPLIISWVCDFKQNSYKILIKKDLENIYVGEKINSSNNLVHIEDLKLEPKSEYLVDIEVWNDSKSFLITKKFKTGTFGKFKGQWISDSRKIENEEDYYKDKRNIILRKKFQLNEIPKKSFIYIVGLGYYNLYINDKKVGNAELNADWTNYGKEIFYDTYNLQEYLIQGENTIFVELGNGWYNPAPLTLFGKYNLRDTLSIGEPKLLIDLEIKFENETLDILSDETWKVAEGPYLFNNIYLGEKIDFRLFNYIGRPFDFKKTTWQTATITNSPGGKLVSSYINKNEITKVISGINNFINEKGNVVFDFGETIEGFIDATFLGKDGQEVELVYGENLYKDLSIDPNTTLAGFVGKEVEKDFILPGGIGAPKIALQKDICILVDGEINYRNKFTYHSFRYVEIKGIEKDKILKLEALYVHTNLKTNGTFECSDKFLNELYDIAKRTKLNNIRSVFEDCARERLGYGGDIVALAESQLLMFDSETIYEKTIKDFRNDMRENGGIPETAPFMGIKSNGTGEGAGPLGWQLVYPYLIDKLYKYYGNKRVIHEEYTYLEKQINYLNSLGLDYLKNCCLGDWGSREAKKGDYKSNSPAQEFTASCFYYYHLLLMMKFSKIIGNEKNYRKYDEISKKIKNEIVSIYMNEDGSFADKSQTSYIFAIYFELSNDLKKLTNEFVKEIYQSNYEIKCGIFGLSMSYEVLRKYNHNDILHKWLYNENGFSQMLKNGELTLKEYFGDGAMGSDNHAMFSSFTQWFYQGLGGIEILEDSVGADKIQIKPYFAEGINHVKTKYNSISGEISSAWDKNDNDISLYIEKPINLKLCTVVLDKKYKESVQGHLIKLEDEDFIYIDIASCDKEIKFILKK